MDDLVKDETKYKFLVIDDDKNFLKFVDTILVSEGFDVINASNADEALNIFDSTLIDAVFCDYQLSAVDHVTSGLNGVELMKMVKHSRKEIPFIIVTGFGTIEAAVDAMKNGAFDFLTKPVEVERIQMVAQKAVENIKLTRELNSLRSEIASRYEFREIIGNSPKMKRLFDIMRQVTKSDATVLIQGESGTGKELVARALHYNSARSKNPFVGINCSAIPETLLEAELFGYIKGAFTGAVRSKKGYFWEAQGGTIFLDEIGDLSQQLQTKLLRVLQERQIRPVGGEESDVRKIDIRIIAASNKSLKKLTEENLFRSDLYYRLAVITVEIPPLRERQSDIPLIASNFIKKYCEENGLPIKTIKPPTLEALVKFKWPGNVRQLENILERAIVLGGTNEIQLDDLSEELLTYNRPSFSNRTSQIFKGSLKEIVNQHIAIIEKDAINQILTETDNNKLLTAKRLGISRASLYNKLKQYNIKIPD